MTTMVAELYDALRSAGAPDEQARAAASAIAVYDQSGIKADFAGLRAEFVSLRSEMATEFGAVRSEMAKEFGAVRSEMGKEFAAVRSEMATKSDLLVTNTKLASLQTDVAVLKWAVSVSAAALLSLVIKAFF